MWSPILVIIKLVQIWKTLLTVLSLKIFSWCNKEQRVGPNIKPPTHMELRPLIWVYAGVSLIFAWGKSGG